MWFFVSLLVAIAAWWIWRTRRYDKFTTLDFDVWLAEYNTAESPFQQNGMAVAFLSQSVHFAWTMSAINSKQRDVVTSILRGQGATTTMIMWLGSALPAVTNVLGEKDVANSPARSVGALMLLVWMSPEGEGTDAVRSFLTRL